MRGRPRGNRLQECPQPRQPHRHQAPQPRRHRRHRGDHIARNAPRRRHGRRGLGQAPDRHRVELERDHPLQPEPGPARAGRQGGRALRRRLPAAVRHDLGLGRHLDGPRGHALLARLARGHRRLGRDRRDGRAPRRHRAARRLRQVDPRDADGQRPPRPVERLPLRRLDRAGLGQAQRRHREGHHDHRLVRGRRRVHGGPDDRGRPQAHRVRVRARARVPAAACTPRTRWRRSPRRSASACPGSAAPPAADRRRDYYAHRSGEAVVNLLRLGITTGDILTKEAFENAIALAMALGGSTNVVLHLLAIAREAQVELDAARLQPHRRQDAAHRRHEAVRQVRHERRRPPRRHPGRS